MSAADNDEALVLLEKIAARDATAMEAFYRQFARQVYAFALRQLGRPSDAGGCGDRYVSGISYACAIVTGAVALTLSIHRDVAPKNVQARLCETAKDLGAPGNDPVFGCGLLQMKAILSAAR